MNSKVYNIYESNTSSAQKSPADSAYISEKRGIILAVMSIEFGENQTEQMHIHEGDDPHTLSVDFIQKHSLDSSLLPVLVDHLQKHKDIALRDMESKRQQARSLVQQGQQVASATEQKFQGTEFQELQEGGRQRVLNSFDALASPVQSIIQTEGNMLEWAHTYGSRQKESEFLKRDEVEIASSPPPRAQTGRVNSTTLSATNIPRSEKIKKAADEIIENTTPLKKKHLNFMSPSHPTTDPQKQKMRYPTQDAASQEGTFARDALSFQNSLANFAKNESYDVVTGNEEIKRSMQEWRNHQLHVEKPKYLKRSKEHLKEEPLSFSPHINPLSTQIFQAKFRDASPVHNRLYKHAQTKHRLFTDYKRQQQLAEELKNPSPHINKYRARTHIQRSLSLQNVSERLYQLARHRQDKLRNEQEILRKQNEERVLKECTHRPSINQLSHSLVLKKRSASAKKPYRVEDDLYLAHQRHQLNVDRAKSRALQKEIEECSFQPHINIVSSMMGLTEGATQARGGAQKFEELYSNSS